MIYTKDIGEWLSRFVLIEKGLLVVDLQQPRGMHLKLLEFQRAMAPYAVPNGKGGFDQLTKLWMSHESRLKVYDYIYRPGGGRLVEVDGVQYINSFHFPDHAKARGRGKIFVEQVRWLWGDDADLLLNFMAHIVQRPWERPSIMPLHIAHKQGLGRGWVYEVLSAVLGPWNVSSTEMETLAGLGNKGQFHDYLNDKLLCLIHETRAKSKKYEIDDAVRTKISERRLMLNLKYGANGMKDIFTRIMANSNAADAAVITDRDRRTMVTETDELPRDEEHYEKLYGMLKDGKLAAEVFWLLSERDISAFNPGMRAPMSVAKKRMIAATESDTTALIKDMIDAGCKVLIKSIVEDAATNDVSLGAIMGALRDEAIYYGRVKCGGKNKEGIWLVGSQRSVLLQMSEDEVRREVMLSREILLGVTPKTVTTTASVVPFKRGKPPKSRR